MCVGPMTAPMAANSFTSPSPVAPNRWPGSIRTSPSASPTSDAAIVRSLRPNTAKATPLAASSRVSGLGTRRVERSMAAAAPQPPATVAITRKSDGLTNVLPEDRVDRVADSRDAGHCGDCDQTGDKSVFEQVLAFVAKGQARDRQPHQCHEFTPFDYR